MYSPPYNHSNNNEMLCIEIAELIGRIDASTPLISSPTLHRELRIKTIYSSLYIEGNILDTRSVEAILDGKKVIGNVKDILEIKNAIRAYELIDSLNPLSLKDLLKAHATMMKDLIIDAGCFRSKNVGVFDELGLVHAGTPSSYVSEVMNDLFEWLTITNLHPLISSCIFHYEFEFCHPFSDGNGRVGRLWQTLLLSKWRPLFKWLPIENLIRIRQDDYYDALKQSEVNGSCEVFVEYMLNVIKDSLLTYGSSEDKQFVMLNHALDYFRNNPSGTIKGLSEKLSCSLRTAERIVADLKRKNKLRREGSARSGNWVVIS